MNTLAEYLKIKKMSSGQEIGEYIGTSIDISNHKNFFKSILNYYIILRTVANEENQKLWDDYERAIAKYKAQNHVREQEKKFELPQNKDGLKDNDSHEARVIPLFPTNPPARC